MVVKISVKRRYNDFALQAYHIVESYNVKYKHYDHSCGIPMFDSLK